MTQPDEAPERSDVPLTTDPDQQRGEEDPLPEDGNAGEGGSG